MKPEKVKKRPPKAKSTKRRKVPSTTSLGSPGKIPPSADGPATSLVWSTAGPTDNDSVEGNVPMSTDDTGRSDLTTTPAARRDAGRPDTTSRTTARHRRRHRHRGRHGPLREGKASSEHDSSPESPRPKRVEITHAFEERPGSTDAGERSAQLCASDMKRQAESAIQATQKGGGGQETSVGRGKEGGERFQQASVPASGAGREDAVVSHASLKADNAKQFVANAACNQIDMNRAGTKNAMVGDLRTKIKTVAPSAKLSGQSLTFDGCANDGASSAPAPKAKEDTTPPCNPGPLQRWKTAPCTSATYASKTRDQDGIARASRSAVADVSEEDYYGDLYPDASPDHSTRTGVTATPFSETTVSTLESRQCRSLGQSWISQVAHEMTGGATPHKNAVLELLRKEMANKSSAEVLAGQASPSISWGSEHSYGPVATDGRTSPARFRPQYKVAEAGGECKGDDVANAAVPTGNAASEVSYVPLQSPFAPLQRESISKLVPRYTPRDSVSRASISGGEAKKILLPVVVISALILLAFVIAFFVPGKHSRSKTALLGQLAAACGGDQTCVQAIKLMTDSLDLEADPCLEFDRFVCGRWRTLDPQRRSYRRESVRNYTRSVSEALRGVLVHSPSSSRGRAKDDSVDVRNMATFYSSCRAFAEEHNTAQVTTVSDVISAMYLDRGSISNGTALDPQSLLQFVVSNSFQSGLPTLVSVTLKGDETFLDIGETLRSTLGPSPFVEEFLRAALGSLGAADNDTVGALVLADSNVSDWRARVSRWDPFNRTLLKHLPPPFPSANWTEAFNRGLTGNGSRYSPDSVVYARGMAEVSKILTLLSEESLIEHGCVYASVVLLAQVMKYEYLFRRQGGYNQTESADPCLEVTGTYFKDLLPRWVTTALVSNGHVHVFKNMVKNLQHTIARRSLHSKSMLSINGSEFSELNFLIIGEGSLTSRTQPGRVTPPSSRYGDQFLLNVVLASRDHVGVDYDEGAVERQFSGELSFFEVEERLFVAVPANFLDADSLVANENVPSLDYASVGVRLLLEWLDWTFGEKGTRTGGHLMVKALEQRVRDARYRTSVAFGSDVAHRDRQVSEFAEWALNASSMVAETSLTQGGSTPSQSLGEKALNMSSMVADVNVSHGSSTPGRGGTIDKPLADGLDQRIQCVRDAASAVFGRAVSLEEGRLLAFVDWATDIASTAAEVQRRRANAIGEGSSQDADDADFVDDDSAALRISRQIFYLRFCHTLCGQEGPLAGACRYRTRSSRDFARAFRCDEPPKRSPC
ncbi:hypothetical protein HPB50_001382 [Hyalomma asiaticum]|uniref:Uncharacterized protein n=1 Tax=Hyalomma asiaticum TaxID=266040 RepID=A0ACB7SAJ3_HYAAI|nr:hypothetical protein HPB50_001382 [Hyalomma asiaticum]